jgi:hypothetical protein
MHSTTSSQSGGSSELTVSRLTQLENTGTGSLVLFTTINGLSMVTDVTGEAGLRSPQRKADLAL